METSDVHGNLTLHVRRRRRRPRLDEPSLQGVRRRARTTIRQVDKSTTVNVNCLELPRRNSKGRPVGLGVRRTIEASFGNERDPKGLSAPRTSTNQAAVESKRRRISKRVPYDSLVPS